MARLTSELVLSLTDRLSKPADGIAARMTHLRESIRDNNAKMQAMQTQMLGAVGASYALFRGLGAPITAAADFEAALNRVQAATSASAGQMKALTAQAREFGNSTKFTATESALAQEMLAKNGLAVADILGGATEASLKLAAASGTELAPAADLVTDVMLNFGKTAGDLAKVADGVTGVMLASKFGFDDYRLALAQAGGVAGGLGVTLNDFNASIAATSSRFASGADAGTSFKTFLQRLVPGSKEAGRVMRRLGLEFFDSAGNMKSMADISQELKEGFAGLSDEQKNDALQTIFGTDAIRTAIGLMEQGRDGIHRLDETIGQASASEQAEARMKGLHGEVEKFWSAIEGLNISIGNALLPSLTSLVQRATELVGPIMEFADANPRLTASVVALTASLIGLQVAAIGARFAFLFMRGGVLTAALGGMKAMNAATKLFSRRTSVAAETATEAAAAILAQRQATYRAARATQELAFKNKVAGTSFKQATDAVRDAGKALAAAQLDMKAANGALLAAAPAASRAGAAFGALRGTLPAIGAFAAALSAPAWLTIAGGLLAVAAGGALLYKYWDRLSSILSGVSQAFSEQFGPALDWIRQKLTDFTGFVRSKVGELATHLGVDAEAAMAAFDRMFSFDNLRAGLTSIAETVRGFFQREVLTEEGKAAWEQWGHDAASRLIEAVKATVGQLVAWFGELPSKIIEAIGSIDLSGIIKWPTPPAWWTNRPAWMGGTGGTAPAASSSVEGRAVGGSILGGRTYLVGERGPELITPSRSGWVHTADETAGMVAGGSRGSASGAPGGSAGGLNIGGINITVHGSPGMNERQVAELAAEEVSRRIRDLFSAGQFDGGYRVA